MNTEKAEKEPFEDDDTGFIMLSNALYSTGKFLPDECDTLANSILYYMKSEGVKIVFEEIRHTRSWLEKNDAFTELLKQAYHDGQLEAINRAIAIDCGEQYLMMSFDTWYNNVTAVSWEKK